MRAWATCLPPAPTAVPGRPHSPLPATLTPPPTCGVPSERAPTAPPVAPPSLPSDLAQVFDEPIVGLGAAPAAPQAPSMARTASPARLNPSPPRGVELPFYHHGSGRISTITAVEVPRGIPMPPGFHFAATFANRLGGQLKAKRTISSSASATSMASSSAYSCYPSCSSDDSESEPGNTATHAPPPTRAAPFGAPAAQHAAQPTAPTAQLTAPPSLPADLARMLDEPIGLGAAPALS